MVWIILALGVVSFGISLPLCAAVGRWSVRFGFVDAAGTEAHKLLQLAEDGRSVRRIPNTGGLAVFTAIAWPMLAALIAVWAVPVGWWAQLPGGDELVEHLPGLRSTSRIGGGLLMGLAVMHVMGLIDDRRALGPWSKLGVQMLVAVGLVVFCDTRVLSFLGSSEASPLGPGAAQWGGWGVMLVVSVAWVVVVTNAMNFLDNMDGLAAGVGLVAASLYLAATLIGGQWFVAALAALLIGALAGFLVFNLPPAKLYLGDGGSLVLGLMLAVISVRTTYVAPGAEMSAEAQGGGATAGVGAAWYGLMMPVLVLAVPLYDFVSVTLIRLLKGQSPFRGDHNHFSHRLLRRGLTKRSALAVILLATLATGLGGVMLGRLTGWQAALVATQAAAVLAVLALLESGTGKQP